MSYSFASRFFLLATVLSLHSSLWEVSANVIPHYLIAPSHTNHLQKREFVQKQYRDFQISDGVAGEARKRASDAFLTPFKVTLSDTFEIGPQETLAAISSDDYKKVKEMAKLAKDAEESFNEAIKAHAADKDLVKKLKAGKRANKVLKLLGQQFYVSIEVAKEHKPERTQKLAEELPKLKKNIEGDAADAGKPMVSALSLQTGTNGGSPPASDSLPTPGKKEEKADPNDGPK